MLYMSRDRDKVRQRHWERDAVLLVEHLSKRIKRLRQKGVQPGSMAGLSCA